VDRSLGVLESVGKKTFDMLSEKDPNLKQTRDFFKNVPSKIVSQKPNLSQLLREAQAQNKNPTSSGLASHSATSAYEKQDALNFTVYFEEFKGVVHLEALEMLSRQSSVKLELQMLNKLWAKNPVIKPKVENVEYLFDSEKLNDDYDLEEDERFSSCLQDFKQLVSSKDKMFNIGHFESLISQYSSRFHLSRSVLEKVNNAYKSALFACQEDFAPLEIVCIFLKFCINCITSQELF
jgi:hypothetical protein